MGRYTVTENTVLMEYYYIINRKCFRGKIKIDEDILNIESKYTEWKSKLKMIHVAKDDLTDLVSDMARRRGFLNFNNPIDFTDYILQKQSA
jgi:hypothetical protein